MESERKEAEEMLDEAEKDDNENANKEKNTRERNVEYMRQIMRFREKNKMNKTELDDM